LLTSAHNGLSQRVSLELLRLGHQVAVALATSDAAMLEAVVRAAPDLIIAPMLTRAIPEAIWRRHVCLIVHPGPPGDRGPSSLDWAILEGERRWGVTVLQAVAELDAGPVWAAHAFPVREASKSALYNHEVTEAAVRGVREAVARFAAGAVRPPPGAAGEAGEGVRGRPRPPVRQGDRRVDWAGPTEGVLRALWSADGSPGLHDRLGGLRVALYGGYPEDGLRGTPGAVLAIRDGAICRATGDGAVWIPSLKRRPAPGAGPSEDGPPAGSTGIKLPATRVLGPARRAGVPHLPLAPHAPAAGRTYRQLAYWERGAVGFLRFAFPNGAMSTAQCRALRAALAHARARPTRVLVLLGGPDYWSNGIHLNVIEAARSPADESWRNIVAIDDLVLDVITAEERLVVAALEGNAGAGGVPLALAADLVWARPGVVLNPHYQGMGGLYGSEYWTYLLPRRVGARLATALTEDLLPIAPPEALAMGLIDASFGETPAGFLRRVEAQAHDLASDPQYAARLREKARRRRRDEARRPLAAYRQQELARMHRSFYGPDPAYHKARRRFVHKLPPATPGPVRWLSSTPSAGGVDPAA
jgi:putative two-component system hydrogenase maturation factor HypX/HoxX